ncbi:MAG: hypothetical protein F6K54_06050 [Okeania sp. SIO3B5]|uniref:hypothetical protein n=1 Tax=Okeania sp. SIO3B5 TaxID=2607811 RepID=UPI0013FFA3FF|nr:hypothetical protein [Okeania sp. SIO3B5]NEO52676.1 hypothetical protein [Okeania sp. SIO3B5]
MDENLMWWFCRLPVIANRELRWIPEASLKRNLEKVLESKPGLSLEETLMIFIQQSRTCSCGLPAKHLQAYLYKIAAKAAKDFYSDYESRLGFLSLEDISQEGFIIASKLAKLLASNERTVDYLYNDIKHKIRDRVFQLLSWKSSDKCKKHWRLRNVSENQLKQALKFSGYTNFGLESHLLAWKSFKTVYAPAKGEKYDPPTPEQREKIADSYLRQRKRSPELKQDNSRIDADFIEQCLKNCIQALKVHYSVQIISLDAPLKNGEGTTFLDQTSEEIYNYEADATTINYNKAYSANFQESEEFISKLDSKELGLLVLYHVFDISMDAIAELYKYKNKSKVSRQINKSNQKWLVEECQKQGMTQKAEELRTQKKLNAEISQLVNEVRKNKKTDFDSQVYQTFLKIWQQLEPSSQEILKFHLKRKPWKYNAPKLSITPAEEEKIANIFQVLVNGILQWLEKELQISLKSCEPLIHKISDLVNEFLIHIYQENINQ